MTLEIHEKMIKVTPEDVERVLSLVNKGKIIPTNGDEKEIVELERLFVVQDTVIPLNHLSNKLEKCDSHGHDFKALYCMYVIGYLLYPVIDHVVKKDMLHVVKDIDNLGRYNWAKFVLDSLARGVHMCREKNRKYVSGCVFFLMILFFERVNPRDELDMPHSLRPCIKYWTDNEVSRRLGKYKEIGGYSNPDACVVLYPIVEKIESKLDGFDRKICDIEMRKDMKKMKNKIRKMNRRMKEIDLRLKEMDLRSKQSNDAVMDTHKLLKQLITGLELPLGGDDKKNETLEGVLIHEEKDGDEGNAKECLEEEEYEENDKVEDTKTEGDAQDLRANVLVDIHPTNINFIQPSNSEDCASTNFPLNSNLHGILVDPNVYKNLFMAVSDSIPKIDDSSPIRKEKGEGKGKEFDSFSTTFQLSSHTNTSCPASLTPSLSLEMVEKEIVINVKSDYLTRARMRELLPDRFISNSIIDSYIAILSKEARMRNPSMPKWFMPTVFSQRVLHDEHQIELRKCRRYYFGKDRFTGCLKDCQQIFIPINFEDKHWHLCIVDFLT